MKTVLVVDDEQLIRWSLCEGLRDRFMVFTAGSVDEAMRTLVRAHVDAVVTDLYMPDRDGIELLRFLKSKPTAPKLFVLTAYASEEVQGLLKSLGVARCIAKPFDVGLLGDVLAAELDEAPAAHAPGTI